MLVLKFEVGKQERIIRKRSSLLLPYCWGV